MSATALARILVIALFLGASFAGAAYARDQVFTAKLAQPVSEATQVIAQSTLWTCEGDTCRAVARHAPTVRACRQLVREAGAVTAYGPEGDTLTDEELARCNGVAASQQAQNQQ